MAKAVPVEVAVEVELIASTCFKCHRALYTKDADKDGNCCYCGPDIAADDKEKAWADLGRPATEGDPD